MCSVQHESGGISYLNGLGVRTEIGQPMGIITTFLQHHLPWVIIVIALVAGGHYWQIEHDARVVAEVQAKQSEAAIKTLQQQITDNDNEAQEKIATLQQIVKQVKTPPEVVAALPQVLPQPLPVAPKDFIVQPDQSILIPAPDVLPLFQDLAAGKQATIELAQCQVDLKAETGIVNQKQDEIVALKKKPRFWKRVGHDLKIVAITAGTVALLLK